MGHRARPHGSRGETGSLTLGKSADLVVVPLAFEKKSDPHELVLAGTAKVQKVLCRGQWIA